MSAIQTRTYKGLVFFGRYLQLLDLLVSLSGMPAAHADATASMLPCGHRVMYSH